MNFTKKEKIIFTAGVGGLLILAPYNIAKWCSTPIPPVLQEKPNVPDAYNAVRSYRINGLVYTVDRMRKVVQASDEKSGEMVWESQGEDRLIIPGAAFPIDVSPSGELWVANVGKKRLEQLDPQTGRFIASWQPNVPFGGCCNPVRFAVLANGRFLTMEKGTRRACIYGPTGELESVVSDQLSSSEHNFYLYHMNQAVHLFDAGTSLQLEVPYE